MYIAPDGTPPAGRRLRSAAAVVLALLLSLTACGTTGEGRGSSGTALPPSPTPTDWVPPTHWAPKPGLVRASGDDYWDVPDLVHLSAEHGRGSGDEATRPYGASLVPVGAKDPIDHGDLRFDLTSLKDRMDLRAGRSLPGSDPCTSEGYVVTCPAARYVSRPFALRPKKNAPRGDAGRIELTIQQKSGKPLTHTTRVVIGSVELFQSEDDLPGVPSGTDLTAFPEKPGTLFTARARFLNHSNVPVGGVTLWMQADGASFHKRYRNCLYSTGRNPEQAECRFPGPLAEGKAYRLSQDVPLRDEWERKKKADGAVAYPATLSYGFLPTGVRPSYEVSWTHHTMLGEFGGSSSIRAGSEPPLTLEETPADESLSTVKGTQTEFSPVAFERLKDAGADIEAQPIVIRGGVGAEVDIPMPASIEHPTDGGKRETNRVLHLVLPEGITPLIPPVEQTASEDPHCYQGSDRKVSCGFSTHGELGELKVRIDRIVPGARGTVTVGRGFSQVTADSDHNPANDQAPITVESQ
ncbi:hypothetical protein ACH4SP_15890 [Streptomyces sp. NPDC021093]|uniref:hypothetical protein n=1 Tax=Streptomyces sp. NPDC021093 TaxID=3365112 RepID=UPI0037BA05E4